MKNERVKYLNFLYETTRTKVLKRSSGFNCDGSTCPIKKFSENFLGEDIFLHLSEKKVSLATGSRCYIASLYIFSKIIGLSEKDAKRFVFMNHDNGTSGFAPCLHSKDFVCFKNNISRFCRAIKI